MLVTVLLLVLSLRISLDVMLNSVDVNTSTMFILLTFFQYSTEPFLNLANSLLGDISNRVTSDKLLNPMFRSNLLFIKLLFIFISLLFYFILFYFLLFL